jgi:methylenetetrahydrofolate dehydrogenase (NADP+)/methenyltetrahydrofolate cyclohydrolase
LLKGAEAAKAIAARLQEEAAQLRGRDIVPCLAILRVGAREDDLSYERGAIKRCEGVGVAVKPVALPEDVAQAALIEEIQRLNRDPAVHGILLFRPLPGGLDDGAVRRALLPAKDVDGITDSSLAAVYGGGGDGYPPCTAAACVELLKHYQIPLKGKRAVVVGRSLVIGKPVSMLLLAEHATVTICHSRSERLPEICREADILVVAAGKAGMIGGESIRPGQVVLDVGIHADPSGKLCGDVRFEEAVEVAEAITPVPGGVGAVTTAILASHVLEAARRLPVKRVKRGAPL